MVTTELEDKIIDMVRQYNGRNEPIGKKMIYERKFAAITTVLKAIKSLEAEGRLVEHMVTLPRGTFCMLMIPEEGQPRDETVRQHMQDMILFQVRRNGDTLDKILKKLEERR